MQKFMYSVFDATASVFGNPFFAINNGVARRSFDHAARDPNTTIFHNPGEFFLYQIGIFDDSNAKVESFPTPVNLGSAKVFSQIEEEC